MSCRRRPSAHAAARGTRARLGLAIAAALLGGCAIAGAPEPVPANLPFETHDRGFALRWALEQGPSEARAAGVVTTWTDREFHLTLGLFGLDGAGRIVSRGTTDVQSRFARGPLPFTIRLRPTGREARYEVRVLEVAIGGFRG
jgi:hypothetical protein